MEVSQSSELARALMRCPKALRLDYAPASVLAEVITAMSALADVINHSPTDVIID